MALKRGCIEHRAKPLSLGYRTGAIPAGRGGSGQGVLLPGMGLLSHQGHFQISGEWRGKGSSHSRLSSSSVPVSLQMICHLLLISSCVTKAIDCLKERGGSC